MEKIDALKLSTEAQQVLRHQEIRLKNARRTHKEIGEIIGVQPTTACQWYKAYKSGGAKAIRIEKRGRPIGKYRTLLLEQEKGIQKSIWDKYPDQFKLSFVLWTRIAAQQLIKQLWGIKLPLRTVREYLKRWGFTPQKPFSQAYEPNTKAFKSSLMSNIRP